MHIIREVVAELERPVLLFSGGKDSIVLLHLAEKAFRPHPLPFPILHVDTGHNFSEVIAFRDKRVTPTTARPDGIRLIIASVQESIDTGRVAESTDPSGSRNRLQTRTLLDALESTVSTRLSAVLAATRTGPAPKERVFSFRDEFGQWDRAHSVPSRGRSTTAESGRANRCGCSRCRTGPSSTSGATSNWRTSICRRSTSPRSVMSSNATGFC